MTPIPVDAGGAARDLQAALEGDGERTLVAVWTAWRTWLERPIEGFDGDEDRHFEVFDDGHRVTLGRVWFVWVPDPDDEEDGDQEAHGVHVTVRLTDVPELPPRTPAYDGAPVESFGEMDLASYLDRVEGHPVFTLLSECVVSEVRAESDEDSDEYEGD